MAIHSNLESLMQCPKLAPDIAATHLPCTSYHVGTGGVTYSRQCRMHENDTLRRH